MSMPPGDGSSMGRSSPPPSEPLRRIQSAEAADALAAMRTTTPPPEPMPSRPPALVRSKGKRRIEPEQKTVSVSSEDLVCTVVYDGNGHTHFHIVVKSANKKARVAVPDSDSDSD